MTLEPEGPPPDSPAAERSQVAAGAATTGRGLIRGRLLVCAAALMWSTSGFFSKANVFEEWPAAQRGPLLVFWRALFASLILLPLARGWRWSPRLIPMVVVFALMNLTFMAAMTRVNATMAIWLQYTAPMWVFLAGVFWFKEPVQPGDRSMMGFSMLGVGVICYFGLADAHPEHILMGVASGVCFAGVVISLRQLREFESAFLVALNHLVTAILYAPYVLSQEHWPAGAQWVYLIGFGMFQIGLPYVIFARGLRTVTGHESSFLTLLEPLLVPVWVYWAWGDMPTGSTLAGGGLILTGLALRYWPRRVTRVVADS